MYDFTNLQKILEMDFSQMRVLPCSGGMCASDEAITLFVNRLLEFFSQTDDKPTPKELRTYSNYMQKITEKINKSEYDYYLSKYASEHPEHAEQMASGSTLTSFKNIPARMQYWAASAEWRDEIRNAPNHKLVVDHLEKWSRLLEPKRDPGYFQPKRLKIESEDEPDASLDCK